MIRRRFPSLTKGEGKGATLSNPAGGYTVQNIDGYWKMVAPNT